MKQIGIVCGLAAIVAAGPALSADLGRPSTNDTLPVPTATDDYHGFYVEGGAGYQVQQGTHQVTPEDSETTITVDSFIDSGFLWARAGYDFERGPVVFGPTLEVRYTNISAASVGDANFVVAPGGRLGFKAGQTLFYGIGYWDFNVSGSGLLGKNNGALGAGIEIPLWSKLKLVTEADYGFTDANNSSAAVDNSWLFRLGLKANF